MPATPFNPANAVLIHSAVPIDTGTLDLLKPEDYLLVHSAPCTATNEVLQETNNAGKLVLYVAFNFQLVYTVDADVLALSGLANYHPGASLGEHSLPFANGASKPFQFPETSGIGSTGRLIYENPTRTPMAGDMTAIQFQIRQIFNDVGGESGYDPGDPDPDDSLPPDYSTRGFGLVWMRMLHISRGGVMHYSGPIYYSMIAGSGLPANIFEFHSSVDTLPETPDENEVAEVLLTTVPGGQYLLPGDGELLSMLEAGADADTFAGLNPTWTFSIELYDPLTELSSVVQQPQTDPASTTWEEVVDAYPPPDGQQVVAIYSLAAAGWLPEPEV